MISCAKKRRVHYNEAITAMRSKLEKAPYMIKEDLNEELTEWLKAQP